MAVFIDLFYHSLVDIIEVLCIGIGKVEVYVKANHFHFK